jgi:Domain of unknown function (DUF4330)/IPT/TIG domain
MALIDDRGRLFGRVNVIDAAIGAMIVALIPLAYASYALFREPQPTLLGVEPRTVTPTTSLVTIKGQNLRAFLRVSFNQFQGTTFALLSPDSAEVRIPELPPGQYDVVLYDVAREVSRLPGAITVEAAPPPNLQASVLIAGQFIGLDDALLAELRTGASLSAVGSRLTVVEVGSPRGDTRWIQTPNGLAEVPIASGRQLPALMRAGCTVDDRQCKIGDAIVEAPRQLHVFTQSGRPVRFVIDEALADGPTVTATLSVRAVAPSDGEPPVRPGDRDQGNAALRSRLATVTRVSAPRRLERVTQWHAQFPGGGGDWFLSVPEGASVFEATITAMLDATSAGLQYRGRAVKVGAPFVLQTDSYVLRASVLRVDAQPASPPPQPSQTAK